MIRRGNLNLVVVLRNDWNDSWLQEEVNSLESLLKQVMHNRHAARCTEVVDLKRYRVYRQPHKVQDLLQSQAIRKPFVFLMNLN
ncbi:MAG: hypothetical protein MUF29_07430 [Chitinophagaceae bacterium]|nr:hypothetical protein [Chitinophagaceae bacterium]